MTQDQNALAWKCVGRSAGLQLIFDTEGKSCRQSCRDRSNCECRNTRKPRLVSDFPMSILLG